MLNKRAKNIGSNRFFGKGYRHIEFLVSCFQTWDTEPTLVSIDMYAHRIDGSDVQYVTGIRHTMTDLGRIDAIAYKLYFTALMVEEYRNKSKYNRVSKVTYTFTDIGPFLFASEQMDPAIEFQRFNRYYFKNKLVLSGVQEVIFQYRNPELSKALLEERIRINSSKKIITDDSLDSGLKAYLRSTMNDRQVCINANRNTV